MENSENSENLAPEAPAPAGLCVDCVHYEAGACRRLGQVRSSLQQVFPQRYGDGVITITSCPEYQSLDADASAE